jgi:hypothetical protein
MKKLIPTQGTCLHCKKVFSGRSDKKYCQGICRSAFHNRIAKAKKTGLAILYKLRIQLENWPEPVVTITPAEQPICDKQMFLRYITVKGK